MRRIKATVWVLAFLFLALVFGGCGGLFGPKAIVFTCPNLEQAIRNAAGYTGQATGPIYPQDVAGIVILNVSNPAPSSTCAIGEEHDQKGQPRTVITSLEGIQHLINLLSLSLDNNQVSNLSPLRNLTQLQQLWFNGNQVSSLSPLQNLVNLNRIDCSYNQISNLTPLQNLTNLARLGLANNVINDLGPLTNLTNLQILDLRHNFVINAGPLVQNTGFGPGDEIDLRWNLLNFTNPVVIAQISELNSRGVTVYVNPQK